MSAQSWFCWISGFIFTASCDAVSSAWLAGSACGDILYAPWPADLPQQRCSNTEERKTPMSCSTSHGPWNWDSHSIHHCLSKHDTEQCQQFCHLPIGQQGTDEWKIHAWQQHRISSPFSDRNKRTFPESAERINVCIRRKKKKVCYRW